MMKKLIAVLVIAVSMSLFSAEKYAVLIAGDYEATGVSSTALWNTEPYAPNTEFWNDLYLQWEMLTQEKGYKPENVIVFFAKGIDLYAVKDEFGYEPFGWIADRYRPSRHGIESITNYAATKENVQAVCAELDSKMEFGDDFLYVWVMSHSSSGSIYLMDQTTDANGNIIISGNEEISYSTFANYFKPLTALNKVYQLSMNYAQNLEIQLQQENAVIISSSINWSGYSNSYRADGKIVNQPSLTFTVENESIGSHKYYHGEVNFHLYSATVGHRPDGVLYYYENTGGDKFDYFSEADVNFDNQISILESYYWAEPQGSVRRISTSDYPNFYNNPSGYPIERSRFISLKYPTLISNNEWAYSEPVPFNICGNIGITNDLDYNAESLNIQEFSNVTFLNGSSSDPVFYPNINVAQGCFVKGETDNFPVNLMGNMTLSGARLENLQLNISALGALISKNGTIKDCEVNIADQSNIVFNTYSSLTAIGNSKITGEFSLPAESTIYVGINSELHLGSGSVFTAESNSTIWLKPFGKLIIDNGAVCNINAGVTVVKAVGSQIIVNGTLFGTRVS